MAKKTFSSVSEGAVKGGKDGVDRGCLVGPGVNRSCPQKNGGIARQNIPYSAP